MQPIETEYRGTTFRSRLEARWAVFFDEMDIGWLYEGKTFQTEFGTYTPDFFLFFRTPNGVADFNGCYAEVKPVFPTGLEINKMRAIEPCLLLIGPPRSREYWLVHGDDEKLVLIDESLAESSMSEICQEPGIQFLDASEKAISFRFDGYDNDRQTIAKRYQ